MKNFKINKNQPPLTDADIAAGKDFGRLLKAYKAAKAPFYKSPKIWLGASSVLVASVAVVLMLVKLNQHAAVDTPFIAPPVAGADIPGTVYVLDAQKDSTVIYPGGSKIHVPANAFLDKQGKAVTGNVNLHYREFKNTEDVFLAGIPMSYDSAGETFHFETAGMMEITASQNGQPLKPNPNALVKVDMVTNNNDDRFNTYYLDTIEKKWKYAAQTNYNKPATDSLPAQPLNKMNAEKGTREVAALELQKPLKPQKQQAGKPRFSIKVDSAEFPEIAVYKNVKFEADGNDYKPEKADVTWADIELKKLPGNNQYLITFINPGEHYSVKASPVFSEQDYNKALEVYNKKFNEYQAKLAKKKADIAALEAAHGRQMQTFATTALIYRTFQVSDFGYWNADHPCRLPAGKTTVQLLLTDAVSHKPLQVKTCYLVEKERNALFAYGPTGLQRFMFDADKHNGLYVLTTDNRVGIARYKDFKAACQAPGNELKLQVTMLDSDIKTADEVRHNLEL